MAIYKIPVSWEYDKSGNTVSYAVGKITLDAPIGNTITGTWGKLEGSGVIYDAGYIWSIMELTATLKQGSKSDVSKYRYASETPSIYPNKTYAYEFEMGMGFVAAGSDYSIRVDSLRNIFSDLWLPSTLPLNITNLKAENPRDISKVGSKLYEDITISWTMDSANLVDYQVIQDGVTLINKSNQQARSIVIPAGTFKSKNNATLKIRSSFIWFGATVYSDWVSYSISGLEELAAEPPRNFTQSSGKIYENISVSWEKATGHNYYAEVYINDSLKITRDYNSANSINIPYGTIVTKSDRVVVRVKSKVYSGGYTKESAMQQYSLTSLESLVAETPTDLSIIGTQRVIEEPLSFSWAYNDTISTSTTITFIQDGKTVHTISGIVNKSYTLPAGTLKSTTALKVRVANTKKINEYIATSKDLEITINDLTSIKPIVSDIALNGLNRDYDIIATITAKNAKSYDLYINNKLVVQNSAINKITVLAGSFSYGINKVSVVAKNTSTSGELVGDLSTSFTLTQDSPIVYSLEPSNVNINIDEVSTISFSTNEFCNRWEVLAGEQIFRGTTERTVRLSRNFFNKGSNKISVISHYSPLWNSQEVRTATREVTFNGYGKPDMPTHDITVTYSTSIPVFIWECDKQESNKQTAFEIQIMDTEGRTIEQKIVNTTDCNYKVSEPLENNSTYVLMVSIKNKYDMWSDFATKIITTSFNELPTSELFLQQVGNSVLVSWDGVQIEDFSEAKIFRMEEGKSWIEIGHAYNSTDSLLDCMVRSNVKNYYKVRTTDINGAYSDSKLVDITINVRNYTLTNIENKEIEHTFDFATIEQQMNSNSVTKFFAGASKPIIYTDKTFYETGTIVATMENDESEMFQEMISNGKVFCLRTWRGKKLFGFFEIASISYINAFLQEVSIRYTEINFSEYRAYAGKGKRVIVYLDGERLLDGSIDMSGEMFVDSREVIL